MLRRLLILTLIAFVALMKGDGAKAGDMFGELGGDMFGNLQWLGTPVSGNPAYTWWMGRDGGDGLLPPDEKLEGGIMELFYGCAYRYESFTYYCPIGHGGRAEMRLPMEQEITITPLGDRQVMERIVNGPSPTYLCRDVQHSFDARDKAYRLDGICVVNGVAYDIRFWMVAAGGFRT